MQGSLSTGRKNNQPEWRLAIAAIFRADRVHSSPHAALIELIERAAG
jgi:hypothetical protein